MRKQRKLRTATQLRGTNTVASRVPFRRVSVEIPEALWARLKNVGVATNTPISRLLFDAASAKYGVATEAEIVALYRTMAGFSTVDLPEPEPEPEKKPFNMLGSFSIDTGWSVPVADKQPEPTKKDRPATDDLTIKKSAGILKPKKT